MPKRASACRSDAEAETNKPKNRFQTILPCEQTCVLYYFINGLCFTSFTGQHVWLHDDVLTATYNNLIPSNYCLCTYVPTYALDSWVYMVSLFIAVQCTDIC